MRGDPTNFRPVEVRLMLRLCHTLHEVPADPVARKRAMLEGLCRVVGADAGVCVVSREEAAPAALRGVRHAVTVSMVRYGMTEEDAQTLAARYRPAAPFAARPVRRSGRSDESSRRPRRGSDPHTPRPKSVESVVEVAGMKVQACVALLRRRPAGRGFSPRDRSVLDLLHSELAWVYRPDLPSLSPDGLPLSPRQRQTLQLLLAGNSEKEIAGQMGLSQNTVHHYVKAIHRHFGVSSRSELLARWVKS